MPPHLVDWLSWILTISQWQPGTLSKMQMSHKHICWAYLIFWYAQDNPGCTGIPSAQMHQEHPGIFCPHGSVFMHREHSAIFGPHESAHICKPGPQAIAHISLCQQQFSSTNFLFPGHCCHSKLPICKVIHVVINSLALTYNSIQPKEKSHPNTTPLTLRQDKKDKSRAPISAKLVANMLSVANLKN